jgi:predicted acyltransferase
LSVPVAISVNPAVEPLAAASAAPDADAPASAPARLVSLDALRGFDMFWILGGDFVMQASGAIAGGGVLKALADQFEHKDWAGFAFYDLIFPLFVFIVGTSLVFSLTRLVEREGRGAAVKRVLRRGMLIFVLGLFYSGGVTNPWPDIRLLGVLQRIALAYTAAGLLFCFLKPRALGAVCAALLVGYWALLTFVPIRDVRLERAALPAQMGVAKPTLEQARAFYDSTTSRVTGAYDPGRNLSNHLDFEYLGGRKYDLYWDPEGLLSTLPAVATCLLGVFAGLLLRRPDVAEMKKVAWLAGSGVVALALGFGWGLQFPIVKKIWTSSFVLVAGGWSLLLLAAFYYVVDVRKRRAWCQPLVWIGMNAITLYVASNLLGYRRVAQRLAGGDVKAFFDSIASRAGDLVLGLVAIALMLWLARFLYRRQIFLRF